MEQRAREKAEAKGGDEKEAKPSRPINIITSRSAIAFMKSGDGFTQTCNAQAAVKPGLQLVVGQAATDKQQLLPMEVVEQQSGQRPEEFLADNGDCSEENLAGLEADGDPEQQMEGYIATGKQKHGEARQPCSPGLLPMEATRVQRMRRKLQTKVGHEIYVWRKTIVEPVFGQVKQARGFRQSLLRGIDKVRGEWALVCLTHNILKLHRLCYGMN